MRSESILEGADAEQRLLARSLGALIAVEPFRSPVELARAVHNATLALSIYADGLPEPDVERLQDLRRKSLQVALSDDLRAISEADRNWLIAAMRNVLGKAGEVELAENRLH